MKKLIVLLIISVSILSCETSEGLKFGTLQKVSHKTFPCDYYEISVAFEGGKVVSNGDHSSFENTQDIKIDQAAYDTLSQYVGEKVVFDYTDGGFAVCGSSKQLTSIRIKSSTPTAVVTNIPAMAVKTDTANIHIPSIENGNLQKLNNHKRS
jgi:hypothetical protein